MRGLTKLLMVRICNYQLSRFVITVPSNDPTPPTGLDMKLCFFKMLYFKG
jgi:hypothetical protein